MAPKRAMPKGGLPKLSIQAIHLTMANLQLGLRPVRQVSAESIARTESILGCPTVSVSTRGCTFLATVHAEDGTQNLTKVSAEVSDRTSRKQGPENSHNKERLSDCESPSLQWPPGRPLGELTYTQALELMPLPGGHTTCRSCARTIREPHEQRLSNRVLGFRRPLPSPH